MKSFPKIFIAGHNGMVGSSIFRELIKKGYPFDSILTRTRYELDLTNQAAVRNFFQMEKPDQVYLAAAKVGGIHANSTFPAEFIFENLMIEANIIDSAYQTGVKKLLFLGSSCIYPKFADQPIIEESLLSGPLESTNEPYAIAKIAGIKLCESYNRQYGQSNGIDFRCLMPTNLYGPGDNYHPVNSHVIPALIRRFHEAKMNRMSSVTIWGTGEPKREFLFVDDLAEACVQIMNIPRLSLDSDLISFDSFLNVGSGFELSIRELSSMISDVIGYEGKIVFDTTKPDGPPRKYLDSTRILGLGWFPKTKLIDGLYLTYQSFLNSFV
jgi:GDP-L-fucose synthase